LFTAGLPEIMAHDGLPNAVVTIPQLDGKNVAARSVDVQSTKTRRTAA
jgi:hypothetical protein